MEYISPKSNDVDAYQLTISTTGNHLDREHPSADVWQLTHAPPILLLHATARARVRAADNERRQSLRASISLDPSTQTIFLAFFFMFSISVCILGSPDTILRRISALKSCHSYLVPHSLSRYGRSSVARPFITDHLSK